MWPLELPESPKKIIKNVQIARQIDRQKDRQTDRQIDRQTDRQTGPTINKFFPKRNNQKTQLTKYSSVNPMSKIDFAPAQTIATGVLPSSVKSALMSNAVKIQFGKL